MIKIKGLDKPRCCAECFFHEPPTYMSTNEGSGDLYKCISRCILAPQKIEDPWETVQWQLNNVEEWCPIIECKR